MLSAKTQDVVKHYTIRHSARGSLFGNQPFANYGYWTRPDLTLEQAAEALTDLVAASAGIRPGDRVLDVGCGYGAGAVTYARRHQPASIVGIDVTEIRIEEGKRYVAAHGLTDVIDLRLGDATHMAFADASFDKLVSVECAFHFDTRRDFLAEAARVLKPGGTLALTDMIPRRGVDPAGYLLGRATVKTGVVLDNPANAYDADVYAQHLRDVGFEDVRVDSILQWSRARFIDAIYALAERESQPESRAQMQGTADRLREYVTLGEDYVLVVARRAA